MKTNIRIDGESVRSRVVRSFNFPILALAGAVLLSTVLDGQAAASVGGAANGSGAQSDIFDAGTNSAIIELDFKPLAKPDSMTIYYPPRSAGGKVIYTSGGPVAEGGFQNPVGGSFKGTSTLFEVVINEGRSKEETQADGKNIWSYEGTAKDVAGNVLLKITMNQTTSSTTPAPTPTPTPAPARTPIVRAVAVVNRVTLRAGGAMSPSTNSAAAQTTRTGVTRVNLRPRTTP